MSSHCSLLLERGVVEKFLDEIHVSQQHAAAAVALQLQGVQGVSLLVLGLGEGAESSPSRGALSSPSRDILWYFFGHFVDNFTWLVVTL